MNKFDVFAVSVRGKWELRAYPIVAGKRTKEPPMRFEKKLLGRFDGPRPIDAIRRAINRIYGDESN